MKNKNITWPLICLYLLAISLFVVWVGLENNPKENLKPWTVICDDTGHYGFTLMTGSSVRGPYSTYKDAKSQLDSTKEFYTKIFIEIAKGMTRPTPTPPINWKTCNGP